MARTKRNSPVTENNIPKTPVTAKGQSLRIKIDHLKTITPLTKNQKKFFNIYNQSFGFIGVFGSAGTGKSYISIYKALEQVLDMGNPYEKVIVVRSAVFIRDSGFLPGSLEEKIQIFESPYVDICASLFQRADAWERLKEQHVIEFMSTTALRGLTMDNAIVVVDEAQSMSMHELNSIITRVGKNSKIIFIGDTKQNDLLRSKNDKSGLYDFLRVAKTMKEYDEVTFDSADIVRSGLVKSWIIACEEMGL